jgi:hypothetical protein
MKIKLTATDNYDRKANDVEIGMLVGDTVAIKIEDELRWVKISELMIAMDALTSLYKSRKGNQ